MIHRTIEIKNESGLHSRIAALFVKTCSRYKSDIYIEQEGFKINAKSIMGIMALGAYQGDKINIIADGHDEEDAIESIEKFLESLE